MACFLVYVKSETIFNKALLVFDLLSSMRCFFWTVLFALVGLGGYYLLHNEVPARTLRYVIDDSLLNSTRHDLLLGSSSIQHLDSQRWLDCGDWLNRGIGNSTIPDLVRYLALSPLSIRAEKILIYAGENDLSRGQNVAEVFVHYKDLLKALNQRFEGAQLHLLALKPAPARKQYWSKFFQLNKHLQRLAATQSRVFFYTYLAPGQTSGYAPESFLSDGIHLTEHGYEVFTKEFNRSCKLQ